MLLGLSNAALMSLLIAGFGICSVNDFALWFAHNIGYYPQNGVLLTTPFVLFETLNKFM